MAVHFDVPKSKCSENKLLVPVLPFVYKVLIFLWATSCRSNIDCRFLRLFG